ncbi:Ankyrin repeat-containing protein BDA1 [Glycine soja]
MYGCEGTRMLEQAWAYLVGPGFHSKLDSVFWAKAKSRGSLRIKYAIITGPVREVEVGIEPHIGRRGVSGKRKFESSIERTQLNHQMRTVISRLIHSTPSISRLNATVVSISGRNLCTDSNKVDGPFKVEEAETVNVPPLPTEKLLVLGGNGFVGSHICREALDRDLSVASLSRSGRSSLHDSWATNVAWYKGNLLSTDSLKEALNGVTAVISCVGGFGSNSYMYKINGTANINAIRAASDQADFGVVNYLLRGYYEGKRASETELLTRFPYGGVILRPGFIYGTRSVGSMKIPLGVIGSPLEMVLQVAKPLNQIPLVGPLLTPPVNVTAVAKVAVRAATDPVFPPGIIDAYGIQPAQVGDIDLLYKLIQMQPYVLEQTDFMPFVDTPLHVAAAAGHASFATEIMRLKPSFAWKLNPCGLSPMHLALQNKHYRMVCRFVDINKDLVRVKGREGLTPLHIATQTGRTDLVAKFLSACPGSIEDVTVRSETALHIAVKYNQFRALEVLVGWLQRNCQRHAQDREKRVLNWQDEAGNTVLHLSVLKGAVGLLIDSNINKNAKNFEDSTALDMVEINQTTAQSAEIRDELVRGGALRGFSLANAPLLEEELRAKITFNERIAIFVTRLRKRISIDTRNALLVVAILFVTSTYGAVISPPGGVYQGEGSRVTTSKKTSASLHPRDYATPEIVGKVVMKMQTFFWFWSFNTLSFYLSILMICLLMPRGRISVIVTFPLSIFTGCYVFSMMVISPSLRLNTATVVMPCIFIVFYCWGSWIYIRLAKKLKGYGHKQKDTFKFSGGNRW